MSWLTEPDAWIALITLTSLEIVLGVDNIIFISILTGRLPAEQRQKGRMIGLALAMLMRLALLASLAWVIRLTRPLFAVLGQEISGRDLILIAGGLFLLAKATHEIHRKLEGAEEAESAKAAASFRRVLIQVALLDMIFSLDSVITAVGMANRLIIMVLAVVIAVGFMMLFARPIGCSP
jgi:predicted tellurium resistance membrane protein TerC